MKIILYGIPTCDTCRKARTWLAERGHDHEWVDLRATPPSSNEVRSWVGALTAKALRNTSGGSFRALGPEKDGWSESEWVEAFTRDPMLVKRPILVVDGVPRAVGFKPAAWEPLLRSA